MRTSAPVVGSSRSTSRGRCNSAIAVWSRRRSPPESSDAAAREERVQPERGTDLVDPLARVAAAQAREPGEEAQVVAHGEHRVHARFLRREADQPLSLLRETGDVDAAHEHGARVGPAQARDDRHQRGLARPVRAEQPEDGPRPHLEIDAGEGGRAAVRLVQPGDGQHHRIRRAGYSRAAEILFRRLDTDEYLTDPPV